MRMRTLAELETGASGTVSDVSKRCQMRRRFLEIGLTPGTVVHCLRESPLGDPRSYVIRGTVFALRHDDALHVLLAEVGQ